MQEKEKEFENKQWGIKMAGYKEVSRLDQLNQDAERGDQQESFKNGQIENTR